MFSVGKNLMNHYRVYLNTLKVITECTSTIGLTIGVNLIEDGHHWYTTLANTKIALTTSFSIYDQKCGAVVAESHPQNLLEVWHIA